MLAFIVCVCVQVVYLPSCVTRMMGPAASDADSASCHEKLMSLFAKGGYEVRGGETRALPFPGSLLP